MVLRRVAWTGEDDPRRHDEALLDLGPDRMSGHGTSISDEYALAWSLDTGPGWVTRRLRVAVESASGSRSLVLDRAETGSWWVDGREREDLADAIDCDLGLCPVTNTMPILRLGLLQEDRPETALVMAWVDVPSLEVVTAPQHYGSRTGDDGRRRVLYDSERRDFHAELTVDDEGIVVDYPGLARRIASAASGRR